MTEAAGLTFPLEPREKGMLGSVTQRGLHFGTLGVPPPMAWSVLQVHHPLSDPGLWVDLGKDRTLSLALLLWKLLNSQECC